MTLPYGLIVLFILYFSGAILPKNIVKSASSKKTWEGKDGWLYRGGIVYRRVLNFLDTITIFHVSYNRNYDDDDDDDELLLWYGGPTKGVYPYFQPRPLSEILTIANLRHAVSRIWTCAETEFRLSWMKLCSSDNHYTTAPWMMIPMFLVLQTINLKNMCLLCCSYNDDCIALIS